VGRDAATLLKLDACLRAAAAALVGNVVNRGKHASYAATHLLQGTRTSCLNLRPAPCCLGSDGTPGAPPPEASAGASGTRDETVNSSLASVFDDDCDNAIDLLDPKAVEVLLADGGSC
jgi:hypothetical protein